MYFGRGGGEAGKEGDGISNVEAADNVAVYEFTKEITVAKTVLALKGSMVGSIFRGTDGVEVRDDGRRDGFEGLGSGLPFVELGSFPAVLEEEATDIGGAR